MSGRPSIALFFGTRPQIIKASALREALAAVGPVIALDTGQHYDYQLHRVHYEQLGVRPPDVYLGVGSESHARQTAAIAVAAEDWLTAERPRLAVVIGDTNSTLGCALTAATMLLNYFGATLSPADAESCGGTSRREVRVERES